MANLIGALERLTQAVERLEKVSASLPEAREDKARLVMELAVAKGEIARLSDLTELAAERLDGAIGTLRTTLED